MKRKTRALPKPVRSANTPATSAMLYEMEERLTHKMDAGFDMLRRELRGDIAGLKGDLTGVKGDVSNIKAELHRVALLVEEQNARNKFVLDGYTQMYELIQTKLQSV